MPIQAGSTLTLFSQSTLKDHDRVQIWGVLLRCGYGGNGKFSASAIPCGCTRKAADAFMVGTVSHLKRIGQQFSTTLARCIDEPEDDPAGSERVETLLGDIRDFCSIAGVRLSSLSSLGSLRSIWLDWVGCICVCRNWWRKSSCFCTISCESGMVNHTRTLYSI